MEIYIAHHPWIFQMIEAYLNALAYLLGWAQVVSWPPIRSYRKNTMAVSPLKEHIAEGKQGIYGKYFTPIRRVRVLTEVIPASFWRSPGNCFKCALVAEFAVHFTLEELKSLRLNQRYSFRDQQYNGSNGTAAAPAQNHAAAVLLLLLTTYSAALAGDQCDPGSRGFECPFLLDSIKQRKYIAKRELTVPIVLERIPSSKGNTLLSVNLQYPSYLNGANDE